MRYFSLPGREDEPWELRRIFAETSPEELASHVPVSILGETTLIERRHAYSDEQVHRVRQLLRLGADIDTNCICRHLDEFAIMIGMQARIEPDVRPVEAIERLERELVAPISALRVNLAEYGLRREFLVQWGALKGFDLVAFEDRLDELSHLAAVHIEQHRKRSRKGRGALAHLKDHHVERAFQLACYFDPPFHPHRPVKRPESRVFSDFVHLLAEPLFPRGTLFVAAVRTFVAELEEHYSRAVRQHLPPHG